MVKVAIVILAVLGCAVLLMGYAPHWFNTGFSIQGHTIPYAALALLGVVVLGLGLKSK